MCSQSVNADKRFVSYVRVSTQKQGQSGLGLEAQTAAVRAYAADRGTLIAQFLEVETGKGSDASVRRPQLMLALEACRRQKATLIIAKLDRLARNVHFVSGLIENGCDFVAADMPNASKSMIQMYAVMSEWERDQISVRTKVALQAAKARGTKLGSMGASNLAGANVGRAAEATLKAEKLRGIFAGFAARQLSQRAMVVELNFAGIATPADGRHGWTLCQVQRLLSRLNAAADSGTLEPSALST